MQSLKAFTLLLLVGYVAAQYNYKKPEPPKPNPTYLPPKPESQAEVAAEGLNPDGEHEPGMPFDFTYAVKEDDGNDFSHQAQSDGDVVKGEYRTLLPDGRTQIVKYTADWKNGYNAEVTYEGEAVFPDPPPKKAAPPPKPSPPRNNYQSNADNDSQGLRPTPQSAGYNYEPPATTRRPPPPPPPPARPQPPPRAPAPRPTTPPPAKPVGLYGTPNQPFGVRNHPKFGYSK